MSEDEKKLAEEAYSADSIQVLEGLEAVRKRPAMYIGDIGSKGLHHLVYEVVDNSIDEALGGYCDRISVKIHKDNSITVADNGRGIPTGVMDKENKSALEVVMTVLHAGGKFDKGSYKVSGGLHGVGVSCVNALSSKLTATIKRKGKIFQQVYERGKPKSDIEIIGDTDESGTIIKFLPDNTIFQVSEYSFDILAARHRELAFLNKGIRLSIEDEREKAENGNGDTNRYEEFYSEEGLKEFVEYLDVTREKIIDNPVHIVFDKTDVPVEIALQYNDSFSENVYSYVNNINTIERHTSCRLSQGTYQNSENTLTNPEPRRS